MCYLPFLLNNFNQKFHKVNLTPQSIQGREEIVYTTFHFLLSLSTFFDFDIFQKSCCLTRSCIHPSVFQTICPMKGCGEKLATCCVKLFKLEYSVSHKRSTLFTDLEYQTDIISVQLNATLTPSPTQKQLQYTSSSMKNIKTKLNFTNYSESKSL